MIHDNGVLVEEDDSIRSSAVSFFHQLLSSEENCQDEPNLDIIRSLPQHVKVGELSRGPTQEEVKKATFDIAAESTPGPDGFTSLFFQACWDIVGAEVTEAAVDFFNGAYLPRSVTATMLVLLPKKDTPLSWADFRPISLCNVTNKIFSKIVASRLAPLMKDLVASNQSGFIRGRLICDNVLLAQEIINDLPKCKPTPNIAIKLDMAKAYDRVQWDFLLKVLGKMGFDGKWLSIIERCINSNWFSVLINGVPGGFFKSSRGLRQGDPLSPALFVIAADYLSRSLDNLILGRKELEFTTSRRCPGISHLAYADDVIIFTKASREGLDEIRNCLDHYSAVSGQRINNDKSHFFVDEKNSDWADQIKNATGFQRGELPFNYLGVPIFRGVKRSSLFLFIRDMISKRIHSWSHKFLSFGGRMTLIKSTLGAMPIHVFQAIEPTGEAIKMIERVLGQFFWGSNNVVRKTHWISWEQICHPQGEGGLGIRRFKDVVEAFGMKLWWRFREQESLWATFMMKKYCYKESPMKARFARGNSLTWKRLTKAREKIHNQIMWSVGEGNIDFWEDSWAEDKPLSSYGNPGMRLPPRQVKDFWINRKWNEQLIRSVMLPLGVPPEVVEKIIETPIDEEGKDCMRWALTPHGNFSTKSAWDEVRHHQPKSEIFELIWNNAIPTSFSIFVWRLTANRIPVDTKMQWRNITLASKCRCCTEPKIESRDHLFVNGKSAKKIWRFFDLWFPSAPLFPEESEDVEYRLRFWHLHVAGTQKDHASIFIACYVMWIIWSERNSVIHRGTIFRPSVVIQRVIAQIQWAVSARKLDPAAWKGCKPSCVFSQPNRRRITTTENVVVRWIPPGPSWIKLNISAAANFGDTAMGGGGIFRDELGEIVAGFSCSFIAASKWEAEMTTILKGIESNISFQQPLWIEIENEQIVELFNNGGRGRAKHRNLVTNLKNKLKRRRFKISFSPKEGNKLAIYLAEQGRNGIDTNFIGEEAPRILKAMARLEKNGLPNLRQSGDDRPP